jgi:hypothetical protein
MPLRFLTPSVDLIRADGSIQAVHPGGSVGRFRPRVYLLARELCAFQLFEASALPRGRQRQAALLFARTASPYVASGTALDRVGADFGVWWWDLDRLRSHVPSLATGRALVRPETMAQPVWRGWRIVRVSHGYEAQLWADGGLVASAWRRQPFDATSWGAFVRLQREGLDAPSTPPTPVLLPFSDDSPALSLASVEITPQQVAIGAVSFGTFASVFAALFLLGQGWRLADGRRAIEAETVELRAATPAAAQSADLREARRALGAYAEIERKTNPLTAAGAALGVLALNDVEPSSLETEAETLTMTLPYGALQSIDDIVSELETSGYFTNVEPRTDVTTQTLTITMTVRPDAPPLG